MSQWTDARYQVFYEPEIGYGTLSKTSIMTVVYFDWLDYLVFGAMLLFSALIGVYFAFFAKKKQNTTAEYLMGGKTMGIFPISMSLIARYDH